MNQPETAGGLKTCPAHDEPGGEATPHEVLAEISRLICELGRLRGRIDAPRDSPDEGIAAWADESYLYVEVRMKESVAAPIDVSAVDRTLFFRIDR